MFTCFILAHSIWWSNTSCWLLSGNNFIEETVRPVWSFQKHLKDFLNELWRSSLIKEISGLKWIPLHGESSLWNESISRVISWSFRTFKSFQFAILSSIWVSISTTHQ
jgi:hypothetical protein